MAPGQAPHQPAPWRDTHPFFLLSPLMGLLSRAWSRLRGPGPPEPWLVETVTGAEQGEAKSSAATHHAPWGRHPQEETGDTGAAEEDGEASQGACPDLKAECSLLESWGLSDDNEEEYGGEEATSVPREQGSEFMDGQPAPLSPSLLITSLQDLPEEEESKEEVTEDKHVITFSIPLSHWECCPGEEEDGEAANKEAPRTSASPLALRSKPRAWVCRPVGGDTEEERTENKAATKTSISPSSAGSHLRAWEWCSGEEPEEEEEDRKAEKGEAEPEPHSSVLAQRSPLRTWQHGCSKITEEEEDEDSDSGAAEASSSIPPTSAFLRAWVYRPGEDTEEEEEEEEEDSDSEAAEEGGESEASSSIPPTSAFLRAWVYRPGEDTEEEEEEEEEESDSEAAEEEGESEVFSSIPPTSAFLRAWVYRPGEDTEEEEEEEDENEDEDDESEAADLGPSPPLQGQSALLRDWMHQPGGETEGREAAVEWEETEPCPFRVAIYLPGEKPPPPWSPPRLPLRLQRRLKSAETPTSHQDPEPPLKTRKVHFSEKVSVHLLAVWAGPAQAARRGPWEQFARDRSRFARRIAQAQEELGPYLTPAARARAWARLGNPPTSLATIAAPTQTLPMSPIQATPLNHALVSSSPPCVSPCLDLTGRRG
ncbi:protein phosphatase 1 regulatory subunit 15A [Hippopotamus amphibius kiboko]|uniref:protein phosphatase 1 regulatory subunit 15A n=1 Tax=Hippopotamus amphibius kiboko TaxID=575201 RepID=UPI0025970996|nr:protein phosphatase 1 regulatory subunit 15A [Hippopotamus amphibius kiboko]